MPTSTIDQVMKHTTAEEDSQIRRKLKVQCEVGNRMHFRNKVRKNSLDDYIVKGSNKRKAKETKSMVNEGMMLSNKNKQK